MKYKNYGSIVRNGHTHSVYVLLGKVRTISCDYEGLRTSSYNYEPERPLSDMKDVILVPEELT